MNKLDVIPHLESNNDGDPRQEYSQWQRWADNSSHHRSRQRRHVDPRWIKSSDDLLDEHVDPQAEQHMSFPEPGSSVPTKRKSAPVQAAPKSIPVNSHLYPNPNIIHDYDDEVDIVSLFSSHDPHSSSTSILSLATTIRTEEEEEGGKLQEPFEMEEFSEYSSRRHDDDRHDHNISSVPHKTTGSRSGFGQDLRMTMKDSSLKCHTTILRAKSSLIRQQEAILRDIQERQAAELQHQREKQQQFRREHQEREAISSTTTAQSTVAVDAGILVQTPETTSTGPVQDPFVTLNKQAVAAGSTNTNSNANTGNSNSTGRQVAASLLEAGDTWNWLDVLRGRRVRILNETHS